MTVTLTTTRQTITASISVFICRLTSTPVR